MFILIQFPIVDVRHFIHQDTGLLNRPNWPSPIADREFVRSFGPIRTRFRGGLKGWVEENEVCEANNIITFHRLRTFVKEQTGSNLPILLAFVRFYSDGQAVAKLEVGLAVPRLSTKENQLNETIVQAAKLLFHLPVTVQNPAGKPVNCELWQAGKQIAAAYAASSTRRAFLKNGGTQSWWVQAAAPIVIIEPKLRFEYASANETRRATPQTRARKPRLDFPIKSIPEQNNMLCGLDYTLIKLPEHRVKVWFIRQGFLLYPKETWQQYMEQTDLDEDRETTARNQVRTIRMYLSRFHAEKECLRVVLMLLATGTLPVFAQTPSSDELQSYFNGSIKKLNRTVRIVSEKFDLGEAVKEVEDEISPGERDCILDTLERVSIRKNILRKVEEYTSQIVIQEQVIMGDKYEVHGQAGAVGPNARAENNTFNQVWAEGQAVDLEQLAGELKELRAALKTKAETPEQDMVVAEIASAEVAAREGSTPKVMEKLAKAGKWALDTATEIGTKLAVEVLKKAMGLP